MAEHEHKQSDDWRFIPPDLAAALVLVALPVVLTYLLVGLSFAKRFGDPLLLHWAVFLGALGVALLFIARSPLYRERRFFAFGPCGLTGVHRKLYCLAYMFVVPSFLVLALLFAFVR